MYIRSIIGSTFEHFTWSSTDSSRTRYEGLMVKRNFMVSTLTASERRAAREASSSAVLILLCNMATVLLTYMYIYIYIYTYTHTHTCMYLYIHTYIYTYYIHRYMCVYTHTCMCY